MTSEEKDEIIEMAIKFVSCFRDVFNNDWEFTKENLRDERIDVFILPNRTFINPGVEDEGSNWSNRVGLLSTYRKLNSLLSKTNIQLAISESVGRGLVVMHKDKISGNYRRVVGCDDIHIFFDIKNPMDVKRENILLIKDVSINDFLFLREDSEARSDYQN